MSGESYHVDTESEYEEKRQELITDAAQTKQEVDQKQNKALEQIASGEDIEEYATVEIGELEIEVRSWLPGDIEDLVIRAGELAESRDPQNLRESKQTMIEALSGMTTSEDYDTYFWREYTNRYGQQGLMLAVETILEPAQESMEELGEARQSFRGEPARDGFRDGVRDAKRPTE